MAFFVCFSKTATSMWLALLCFTATSTIWLMLLFVCFCLFICLSVCLSAYLFLFVFRQGDWLDNWVDSLILCLSLPCLLSFWWLIVPLLLLSDKSPFQTQLKSWIGALIAIIAQFVAIVWYIASYIPYGAEAAPLLFSFLLFFLFFLVCFSFVFVVRKRKRKERTMSTFLFTICGLLPWIPVELLLLLLFVSLFALYRLPFWGRFYYSRRALNVLFPLSFSGRECLKSCFKNSASAAFSVEGWLKTRTKTTKKQRLGYIARQPRESNCCIAELCRAVRSSVYFEASKDAVELPPRRPTQRSSFFFSDKPAILFFVLDYTTRLFVSLPPFSFILSLSGFIFIFIFLYFYFLFFIARSLSSSDR